MAKPKNPKTPLAKRLVEIVDMFEGDYDLPSELKVSYTSLSEYQRGKSQPKAEFFERLNKLTGVNLTWLLTGEGIAFEPEELDVPASAASHMNMKDGYVKAITDRLIGIHSKTNQPISPDLFWWVITTVHQELVERFDGADVSAEEMEPILDAFIDQQAKKAGW